MESNIIYEKKQKKEIKKDKIKVLFLNQTNEYLGFLRIRYDVEIVTKKEALENTPDVILFTGGADVNPKLYGEKIGSKTFINAPRDKEESNIFKKIILKLRPFSNRKKALMLGICRGSQLLTVLNGGKLIQHVNRHAISGTHNISTNFFGSYKIPSTHHQMCYPFNLDKRLYELISWSTNFRSTTYLDGNDEEIKLYDEFLEPEIIYFKKTNSLAIQGHPEMSHCPLATKHFILTLVDQYLHKTK